MAIGSMASARAAPPLLLTAGEFAGIFAGMRAQTYAVEQAHAFCRRFILATAEHLDLCKFEIPHNSEMREQLEMLKHHADAGAQLRQVGSCGR
jgi:hypothetical protein